jgi:putative tryptophan/tyrosine transport system substrate-binding protein
MRPSEELVVDRRAFMVTLAGGLLAAPLAAEAQQAGRLYRIGLLADTPPKTADLERVWEALRQGLGEHGYVEGQNLLIVRRYSEGNDARYAEFAAELVTMKVDLILTASSSATHAAKQATRTIPIVMLNVSIPERQNLIASLARPGGNVTGLSNQIGGEASVKMLGFLRDTLPRLSKVGILWNPDNQASAISFRESELPAAQSLRIAVVSIEVRRADDLDSALAAVAQEGLGALWAHLNMAPYRARILEFAAGRRLPVVGHARFWADAGALMTYGPDTADLFRRGASYVVRIFNGAKPAALPVEQPIKFELIINLKTAKALGLTIPPSLLQRADQVIE